MNNSHMNSYRIKAKKRRDKKYVILKSETAHQACLKILSSMCCCVLAIGWQWFWILKRSERVFVLRKLFLYSSVCWYSMACGMCEHNLQQIERTFRFQFGCTKVIDFSIEKARTNHKEENDLIKRPVTITCVPSSRISSFFSFFFFFLSFWSAVFAYKMRM